MRWFNRTPPSEPDPTFLELLSDHGLAAFERQAAFTDRVGDRDWQLDQERGILTFGDDLSFPAQVLGSEADRSRTWLWAWANESVEPMLTERAAAAREIGQQRGITVLSDPQVDLDRVGEAYLLVMATAGLLEASAYYPCPYPGGAAYVLLELPRQASFDRAPAERAARTVARAVEQVPILVSRRSIERYLHLIGAAATFDPDAIRVDEIVTFRFDEYGRLTDLEATLEAAP